MDFEELVTQFEEFFSDQMYDRISGAVHGGEDSLLVDFQEMDAYNFELCDHLRRNPEESLEAAEEALGGIDIVSESDMSVRFSNMPEEDFVKLKDLRSDHIGEFIPVEGMIKRASQVKPEIKKGIFECVQCSAKYEKKQDSSKLKSPYKCEDCGSRKFEVEEKIMTDTQVITLEENPENREGSEQPTSLSVRLEGDLVDPEFQQRVVPGNVAHITGVLREKPLKKNSKKYDIYMDANYLEPTQMEFEELELTEEEEEEIEELAKDPEIFEKISRSIAPSIFGHDEIKKAIALQLFGGVKKTREDGVESRGDIHILLIGEPGTGKSQMLEFTGELSPKGRYVVGKSSTGAGLCVTGDTLIHTGNGLERIDSVVEDDLEFPVEDETATDYDGELYSYSGDRIEKKPGSAKWRMPEKPCVRIQTGFGKEIEASENTDVLVAGENGIEWRKIDEVEEGDYVAAPDYSEVDRTSPEVMDYFEFDREKLKLSEGSVETIRRKMKEKYGSLRAAADEMELSESFVYTSLRERYIPFRRLQFIFEDLGLTLDELEVERAMLRNGSDFKIPEEFDSGLMYLIGLVFGDGDLHITEDRAHVRISNSDRETLEKAREIIQEKFDKKVEVERQDDRVPSVRVSLKTVAGFMENVGMQSPKESMRLDPRLTTAENADSFLRGLMDADGCVVNRDNGSDSVQFSSISPELGRQVHLILETYGIKARKRTRDRRGTYRREDGHEIESKSVQTHLVIRGENVDRFKHHVGFSIAEKKRALEAVAGKDRNPNNDTLPVSQILEKSEAQTGNHWSYFNQGKNPGQKRVEQILQDVSLEQEVSEKVEEISSADLRWEEIKTKERTGKKELYDLTVEDSHNFIGNGIVTHNTASVVKEESTGEFSLEAGAVVLAHKGMAAIDEIDKMGEEDRSSLHEAMEQQQISVSKANIQATLNAETAILAAGNPKLGRFDPYEPIPQQISIGDTLLSRFDFIFPVKDEPDEEKDTKLSSQVLKNHMNPEETSGEVSQEMLRKYVAYAQRNIRPELTQEAADKIQDFYVGMRSSGDQEEGGGVPITARQLEALVRVAEASARAELSQTVTEADAQRAIDLLKYCLKQVGVDPETGDYDIDMIESGVSSSQRNRLQSVKKVINDLGGDEEPVEAQEVVERSVDAGIPEEKVEEILNRLKSEGELFEPEQGKIQKL
ncbi:MAG: LAGLIDADG family homing endonuclease [Candidatus Nanohaloarchaea archaeon]